MALSQSKSRAGITLIEVMSAIVIIAIAVLGASAYRYYSTLDGRKAVLQSTAARVALLLNENWRGRGYDHITDFDPVSNLSLDMAIAPSGIGPDYATGFTALGQYEITVNDSRFWAALSYRTDSADLRTLNTVIAWAERPNDAGGVISMPRTFRLTTFVTQ
ncbi:MAG: prepilin-type N-terminal cleavage/methylation domain-containing protein [Sedimentisphaerales bacterium]|nr:prepilin-type N-terminal cleavage/methylation domain-containing protein [Sedimentisphaerales bacterium]